MGRWAFAVAPSLLVDRVVSVLSDTNGSLTLEVDIQHSELVACYFMGSGEALVCGEQIAFKVILEDLQDLMLDKVFGDHLFEHVPEH